MVLFLITLAIVGGGTATIWLDLWSPDALVKAFSGEVEDQPQPTTFIEIPQVLIDIPESRGRHLALSALIETDRNSAALVEELMPRIRDSITGFLFGIDQLAYDRRGVLDIIRDELTIRIAEDLGDLPFHDLLITEFRIR